ncbi:MAG TPA: CARDB domain-containing protein [Thermomicrobiaceae bacterium]|nr:CARDB domain-containing protein [Thermomicrobiaceae bacterium]
MFLRRARLSLASIVVLLGATLGSLMLPLATPAVVGATTPPDLSISPITLVGGGSLTGICAGTSPTFQATIKNNGGSPSGAFSVTGTVSGTFGSLSQKQNFPAGLDAGASTTQQQTINNIPAGNYSVTLTINPDPSSGDTNTADKSTTASVGVVNCNSNPPPPTTCTISSGSWGVSPTTIQAGQSVQIAGDGFQGQGWSSGETVTFVLVDANGTSFSLGQGTVACNGSQPALLVTATIPSTAAAGAATVRATDSNGNTGTVPLQITAASSPSPSPSPSPTPNTVTLNVTAYCFQLSTSSNSLVNTQCSGVTGNGQAGTRLDAHTFQFTGLTGGTTLAVKLYPTAGNQSLACDASVPVPAQSPTPPSLSALACTYANGAIVTSVKDALSVFQPWVRTDSLVASGAVSRTWMWGPDFYAPPVAEPYQQATEPNGSSTGNLPTSLPFRFVVYFDKSRMEITHPGGDPTSVWYITNGLLAEEMITGKIQGGDSAFVQVAPAQVNVAGDPNDPNGPTYATFTPLMGYGAIPNGWKLTQTLNRAGQVGNDSSLASYNVTAVDVGAPTHHTVASVFWSFMNSSGPVVQNGQVVTAPLFQNPFYATGYPITEAYWTNVLVGGVSKQVLVQCFERRCLTYTPSNPAGWQVEAGNVGQHYYIWRYQQLSQQP